MNVKLIICTFPDPDLIGYDIFDDLPDDIEMAQKSNKTAQEVSRSTTLTTTTTITTTTPEKSVKPPAKRKSPLRRKSKQKDAVDAAAAAPLAKTDADGTATGGGDSDAELFEIEESDTPLIPLYHLRDEGTTKWVLLSDLCYLLKVKSKDTLLKLVSIRSYTPTRRQSQSICLFNFVSLRFCVHFSYIPEPVQQQMPIRKICCVN